MRVTNYLRSMQKYLWMYLVVDFVCLFPDTPAVAASVLEFEKIALLETPLRD